MADNVSRRSRQLLWDENALIQSDFSDGLSHRAPQKFSLKTCGTGNKLAIEALAPIDHCP